MSYVVDTNVISEVRKGSTRCDGHVWRWFSETAPEEIFLSVIVLGEIRKGAELIRARDPAKTASLERWLRDLKMTYDRRILPITEDICDLWGRLTARAKAPMTDGLIAATARYNNKIVITRNEADFQRMGVDYFNPFRGGKS